MDAHLSAYVFVGPTLSEDSVRAVCDVVCLPPVAQGDVYRVTQMRPRVIGIIDGVFHGVPSVWHKEILWAMGHGIHVFGSASMGALRAAELHDFGMQGVGRIFEDYRDGRLEDDDEVAVLHGPKEMGFASMSEPMVNIRATLEHAADEGIIGTATATTLGHIAKGLFYRDRTWDAVMRCASAQGLSADELGTLQDWLPKGTVDLKREDALAMLVAMRDLLASEPDPKKITYNFEQTDVWEKATASSAAFVLHTDGTKAFVPDARLIDELRLEKDGFHQARQDALLRYLALREADRRHIAVDRQLRRAKEKKFRLERDLVRRSNLDRWRTQNEVDEEALERLMEEETRLENVAALVQSALDRHLITRLKIRGDYARLLDRARKKQRVLESMGVPDPDPQTIGMAPPVLRAWYFETQLGQMIPDDLDAYARDLGLTGKDDLYRLLAREYLYWQHKNNR